MKGDSSRAWTWRHAIAKSDLPPTTKHVLLTLSIFMSEAGQSCFPSIDDLVEATSLSKRAVMEHLQRACAAGWLKRSLHGFRGQRWRRLEYEPLWPQREVDTEQEQFAEGGDAGSPPLKNEVVTQVHEGGDRPSPKVVTQGDRDRDQSIHQSNTSPSLRENARERGEGRALAFRPVDDPEAEARWQTLIGAYPAGALGNLAKAKPLFLDLDEANQVEAAAAVPRVLLGWKGENRSHKLSLETYLRNEDWKRFPQPKNARDAEPAVELKPYSKEVWAMLWRLVLTGIAGRGNSDRIRNALGWVAKGMVTPSAVLPSTEELAALVPVEIGSEAHREWLIWAERVGLRLPQPDAVPVIFVPGREPPHLRMTWKGYHLAVPVDVEVRSPAWWWRVYQEKAPIADLLADRSHGRVQLNMGPLALRSEAEKMIEIPIDSVEFAHWELWFQSRGVRLLALNGSIFVPSEYPPREEPAPTADYEALEHVFGGEAA